MSVSYHRVFAWMATGAVVATVAWGFWLVGSPDARRLERTDERRVSDLQDIMWAVQAHVRDRHETDELQRPLPASLADVAATARHRRLTLEDPETGLPYGYRVTGATTYELCATFALARSARTEIAWNHPAGRHCFPIDALDPP